MKKILSIALLSGFVLAFAGIASADSKTANLQVNATVIASCTVSTSAIDFGSIPAENVVHYATGSVTVNCPLNTSYHVTLGGGLHSVNPNAYREMHDGTGTYAAAYRLFKGNWVDDWGDNDYDNTYTMAPSLSGTGTGSDQVLPVWAMNFSGTDGIPAGTVLSDTVIATIYY
ncbi:MAG TPA: spore coat U domain-containing protein [Thermodesulfovibrionales bacterium]|nr:spore coat U domain-containing protein [Thermodesulfovibrionales bacterium]